MNLTSLTTAWIALIVAGLFEVGWPIGFKLSSLPQYKILGWVMAAACLATSGFLLWWAQKSIPIGTAYAVWTGIGAVGTFLVGVYYFGDSASIGRFAGVALIVLGLVTLKLAENAA